MPKYEITSPDGKRFEVTAPEGATQEQVLSYAQSKFAETPTAQPAQPAEPSSMERLGKAAVGGFMQSSIPGAAMNTLKEASGIANERYGNMAYEAGGGVTDIASKLGASPEVAAGAGYATNVGLQAIPAVAGALAGSALQGPIQNMGRGVMQGALKPAQKMRESGAADKAAETMLKYGINATRSGREQPRILEQRMVDEVIK